MVAKLNKVIRVGIDSDDNLIGGSDPLNNKFNTDDLTDGNPLRYEGGVESDFGLLSDFSRSTPQFPNKFLPNNVLFDSDINSVVSGPSNDANHYINNVGTGKDYLRLNNKISSYYILNVYKSLDSGSSLIDPLNPNA